MNIKVNAMTTLTDTVINGLPVFCEETQDNELVATLKDFMNGTLEGPNYYWNEMDYEGDIFYTLHANSFNERPILASCTECEYWTHCNFLFKGDCAGLGDDCRLTVRRGPFDKEFNCEFTIGDDDKQLSLEATIEALNAINANFKERYNIG